jgi:uncharacterized membrane protein YecN with MAPEG domain
MTNIQFLPVSAIYIALLTLLIIFLAYRVTLFRRSENIALGDDKGSKAMKSAVRVHANAVENVPLALILLVALELNSLNPLLLHVFGTVLFVSRLAHAYGLSKRNGPSIGRFYGTLFTWLNMLVMAVLNIWLLLI